MRTNGTSGCDEKRISKGSNNYCDCPLGHFLGFKQVLRSTVSQDVLLSTLIITKFLCMNLPAVASFASSHCFFISGYPHKSTDIGYNGVMAPTKSKIGYDAVVGLWKAE